MSEHRIDLFPHPEGYDGAVMCYQGRPRRHSDSLPCPTKPSPAMLSLAQPRLPCRAMPRPATPGHALPSLASPIRSRAAARPCLANGKPYTKGEPRKGAHAARSPRSGSCALPRGGTGPRGPETGAVAPHAASQSGCPQFFGSGLSAAQSGQLPRLGAKSAAAADIEGSPVRKLRSFVSWLTIV